MEKDLFNGLERGVFEITMPEEKKPEEWLQGFNNFVEKKGYKITRTLVDTKNNSLYHLYFEKQGKENA